MRIAVVSPFVDKRHGTERAVAELIERLARDYGCEVHLYAQCVDDLETSAAPAQSPAKPGRIVWHRVPRIPGPHVLQFLAWVILNSIQRRWDSFRSRIRYDLVLSPGINCVHADVVIVHAVFHRLHELASEDVDTSVDSVGRFRRLHRRIYYVTLDWFERTVYEDPRVTLAAVSARTAALVSEYFLRNKVAVIPNGVDPRHFSTATRLALRFAARRRIGFEESDFVLLLIGNDWRAKGLPTILEAVVALRDLPVRLIVVGSDAAAPFRARAKNLGVLDRCVWERPRADALDFYAAADLYVSPSLEDSFGLPVAEAMACGLPVISSSRAGVAECLENGINGFVLSNPRDSQSLAEVIRRLHNDGDFRERLGEAAARTIATYTWDRHAAGVFSLLKETCDKKSVRGENSLSSS